MTRAHKSALAASMAVVAVVWLAPALRGQTYQYPRPMPTTWAKTPWGDPDLQGLWTIWDPTPLEAPDPNGGGRRRAGGGEGGGADLEAKRLEIDDGVPENGPDGKGTDKGLGGGMGRVHFGPESPKRRSLIVDPPNGRIPNLPREAELRTLRAKWDTWESHGAWSRCITKGVPGPILNGGFNGYDKAYRILQTPGYVVLFPEEIHDARIFPLDGRPHVDSSVRLWNGDSRAHFEGPTLVVETTNFKGERLMTGDARQTEKFRLTERFTRLDDKVLDYQVTFEDPNLFSQPWTARQPHNLDPNYVIYEYACHEGNWNYMSGSLKQGRTRDAEAVARKTVQAKAPVKKSQ